MTKKTCPLGKDCDLTIAWMAGRESAKDERKARIAALEAKLAKAVEALEKLDVGEGWAAQIARTTLAELTGAQKDGN